MDYTDFLLCIAAYKFQNSKIITENHSHFPKEILNRDFIITIDYESDIRNYGIYSFSQEKFQKARQNILKKI